MDRWRKRTTPEPPPVPPPATTRGIVQVCHPEWRGVRESTHAFGDPVVEQPDLATLASSLPQWREADITTIVIQGWPPGAEALARAAQPLDIRVLTVFHSAPTQHGVDAGEAEAVEAMLRLHDEGLVDRVATVKAGVRSSFAALGHDVVHLENRVPDVGDTSDHRTPRTGLHAGIFLHPMWRKNVTTQVLAAVELGATPHVMADPGVGYLANAGMVVHDELRRDEFLEVLATMHIALNVTLSECHPMLPMESYRLGVPCLLSRTSNLFFDDPELYDAATVGEADDPSAIAATARIILDDPDRLVVRANEALDRLDERARATWDAFVS